MTLLDTLFGALDLASRAAIVTIVWRICRARRERDPHVTRYLLYAVGCRALDLGYVALISLPWLLFPQEPLLRQVHNPASLDDTAVVFFIRSIQAAYGPLKQCLDVACWGFIAWAVLRRLDERRQDSRNLSSAPG